MKKVFVSLALLAAAQMGIAKDIKGTITDAATGQPIAGVSVEAYGNPRLATMTAKDGTYSLTLPDEVSSLFIHAEGQQSQQVAIGTRSQVDAQLFSDAFLPNYSKTTTANRFSGTTGFDNNVELCIDPFIQQRLGAEVRSISRGGVEGLGNVMFIGGINSINTSAQPLIVVDGAILDMQYDAEMLHNGYFNNMLANINVNDIDKVEVLKNGTAIYGAKGANGVILITTKRNKSLATKIDVTIGAKLITQPRTANMMDAEDYRALASELLSTETTNISSMKFLNTDKSYYYYPQFHNNTNWKDEAYRDSWAQKYGISVQGGDDVASYNLSVGYMLANTPLKQNDVNRFDMRLNTDIDVIRNLHVRFDASFSDVKRNLRDVGFIDNVETGIMTSPNALALIKAPFLSPLAYDKKGNLSNYLAQADTYLNDCSSLITNDKSLPNPKAIVDLGEGDNRNTFGNRLVTFNVTPSYQFNKNLKVSEHFNFTLINTNENYFLPIEGVADNNSFILPGTSDLNHQLSIQNIVSTLAARQTSIQSDTRVEWNKLYGKHSIKAFGGFRIMSSNYNLNIQSAFNSGNDKTPLISSAGAFRSTKGNESSYTDLTYYATADYNYAEKWYASAGFSAQASSRFGLDADALKLFGVRWGLFPSVQGSWVMTNEKFLANTEWLNYLRLNLGYDLTGNDNIDYTAARTYFVAKSMLGTNTGSNLVDGKVMANVGNSKLKWETTRRITAGVEANLFNNKLSMKFNFFKSFTSDLLTYSSLAWVSGMSETLVNDGKMTNTGIDFSANYKAINTKNWHWEFGASMGHYKNKVTQLSGEILTNIYGATVLTYEGNPLGVFYGHKTAGVFASTEEAKASGLYYLDDSGSKVYFQAGDMKFVDANGDKCIDDNDRMVIGDPNPDIYGNIYSRLNYKKWQLDMNFTYSVGNDVYNYERSLLEGGKYFFNQTTAMNRRWTTEGQVTDIPRVHYMDPNGNARFSDRWIEDGSYLRLSNVTLSYTLPLNSAFLQGITVWGSVQNLFTITPYLGSNPDCTMSGNSLYQGIDTGLLGRNRSFSMGVKINL